MAFVDLEGVVRPGIGKGVAKRLRAAQQIPAIVYGGSGAPVPVAVKQKDLAALLVAQGRGNVIVHLSLAGGDGGAARTVLLKEVQIDPVRGGVLHADFLEISLERKIKVEVPLELDGVPVGKAKGGLVEWHLREVAVECLPLAIPQAIRVDISALDLGDALHVRDLPVPEGVRVLGDGGRAVVAVTAPAAEEEAAPAVAEAAPAEPEVLTKREGKEEAAAAAPAEEKGKKEPEKKVREPEKKGKE
ncbi:MAG TPA: 50S ribosomal protein L25 [Candidatus Sulfotelmatobacter sp.]|nr:50S ribosomal protein L25 [Candidatus Sulfotelmatobacter sp.]